MFPYYKKLIISKHSKTNKYAGFDSSPSVKKSYPSTCKLIQPREYQKKFHIIVVCVKIVYGSKHL